MKLLYSSTSPYSAKVHMGAHHVGVAVEPVPVDTAADPALLTGNNPLGKIPTLLTEDGQAIFDSVAIMRHLDRLSGGRLYPAEPQAALQTDILEALADGICDSLLSIVYERRYRPEEKIHQGWIDRQWEKAVRALDHIEAAPPATDAPLTAGDFALAATLGYLKLRFAGQWEESHPKLVAWLGQFETRFPAYEKLKPQT